MKHQYYENGDKDAPICIKDGNYQIALSMCKVCGLAEGGLTTDCPGQPCIKGEAVYSGKIDFIDGEWVKKS